MMRRVLLFPQPPMAPKIETIARRRPMTIIQMGNEVMLGSLSLPMTSVSTSVAMPIEKMTRPIIYKMMNTK